MDMQRKTVELFDFKARDDKDEMTFEGYLSVFGNVDSYGDIVEKGAFAKTLAAAKAKDRVFPVLEQHGGWHMSSTDTTPIGYFAEISEDEVGLKVRGVLFPTDRGKEVYTILKTAPKSFMGMSIGYRVIKKREATRDEYSQSGVKTYLEELDLMEGSIVTFPANSEARVENVKSFNVQEIRNIEKALTESGFSRNDAKKCVSVLKSCMNMPVEEEHEPEQKDTTIDDFIKNWKEEEIQRSYLDLKKTLKGI